MGLNEDLTREKREAWERGFTEALDRIMERIADTDMVTMEAVREIVDDIKYDVFGWEDDFGNGIAY